ncbi:MAG: hypothetical protein ABS95_02795 [Verrucomicrobia bacterium SCN 57-15]|nr:MAG: hypothetical protein ABS95_02795 [Verrucomicrobia bacterium SCN 57-15]
MENPSAIAVVFGNDKLTYHELNERAKRLARRLTESNAGPDVLVGIYMERSLELIVGLLAILKSGAAYVPLDPAFPGERLAQMISNAALPIILTQQQLVGSLPASTAKVLVCDTGGAQDTENLSVPVSGENLAYVIYTSGSTGKPKGVQIAHRSVMNVLTSIARTCNITAQDNLLAVTTISFDIAALELFLPLIDGGTVTLASREQASDGTQLSALLESSAAMLMQATPATWRLLIEAGWQGKRNLKALCGGEALTRKLADDLLVRAAEVWNMYGPTETTIWSSVSKVLPDAPISIGRPLANTQIYILDRNLQSAPVGVVGELHIGGDGLAREYLKRPDLTERLFIENPFGKPESRLYKTGDLARYLPDGTIECLGRVDRQVKVRGFRIELGEIEAVLRQHCGIREVLVAAHDNGFGEKRLSAYLVARNGTLAMTEMRAYLESKLPLYMIPAHFIALNEFPLTPNGKIDFKRLPKPGTSCEAAGSHIAPRDEDERQIAEIWQAVLGLERVGIADNVFHLGCDSLSATRAFARINASFATNITLREIFEHPTISAQAEIVRRLKGVAPAPIIPRRRRSNAEETCSAKTASATIQVVTRNAGLPLSSSQLRLWLAEQIQSGTCAYNVGRLLTLKGPLNRAVLAEALNEIVKRHEILRTVYDEVTPQQRILPEMKWDLACHDLTSAPEAKRREVALMLARAAVAQPFDLANGPLFRADLMSVQEHEHLLALAFHQIVTDAWSYRILCNELASLYSGLVSGVSASLPPLPIQYADYAAWQRRSLADDALKKQFDYWREKLSPPLPRLKFLPDSVGAKISNDSSIHVLTLEGPLLERLRQFNAGENVTRHTTLLAVFKLLLHHWTAEIDVVVGSPEFGRPLMETENLLGHFVNILILRTRTSAEQDFRTILTSVRHTSLDAVANADVPFEELFKFIPSNGESGADRFFQAWFGPIDSVTPFQMGNLIAQTEPVFPPTAQNDLALFVSEGADKVSCYFRYKHDLFPENQISNAAHEFESLLEKVIAFPTKPVQEILSTLKSERMNRPPRFAGREINSRR